jgi:hypothetical protein
LRLYFYDRKRMKEGVATKTTQWILFLNRIVQKLDGGDTTLDGRLHKIPCTDLATADCSNFNA